MDPISLMAGALAAAVMAIIIYRQRRRLTSLRRSAEQQVTITREKLTRSAADTYRDAVIRLANGLHIGAPLMDLERIAVLPRFTTPHTPTPPLSGALPEGASPLDMIPRHADWPEIAAAYSLPGIPLNDLLRGGANLAVLGAPGSGRTTALALLAILLARQTERDQPGALLDEVRMPLYAHFGDLALDPDAYDGPADPLDPLLGAMRYRLRGLATRLLGAVRGEFEDGRGVILLDGWDELPPAARERAIRWLRVLMLRYPGNRIVAAGPLDGSGPLLGVGLSPVTVMPWRLRDHAELARRWTAAWAEGRHPAAPAGLSPTDIAHENAGRLPLDATLHLWALTAGDDPQTGRAGWYRAYVARSIPAPGMVEALRQLALLTLLPGASSAGESPQGLEDTQAIEDALADDSSAEPAPGAGEAIAPPDVPEFDEPAADLRSAAEGYGFPLGQVAALAEAARSALSAREAMSTPDFLYAAIRRSGLLTERLGKRVGFSHRLVAGYLAAEAMRDAGFDEGLAAHSGASRVVLPFLATIADVTPYVEARLSAPRAIFAPGLLEVASWAADADRTAGWRGPAFRHLAEVLLAPGEYPALRERAAAALVASRDPNVMFIFREGLKHAEPSIRALSALGLGAVADAQGVISLGEMLEDPEPVVETAAALGLGAVGSTAALNYLIQVLLSARDAARQAAAEMLGLTDLAGEGHAVLKEAIDEQDAATRRAAVLGLVRCGEPWAVELATKVEGRDEDWAVRAAASSALEQHRINQADARPPAPPTTAAEMPQLVEWMAARRAEREEAPPFDLLLEALRDGGEATRVAAAGALGEDGSRAAVRALYAALRDPAAPVRDAAYRALGSAGRAAGAPLPGVLG